MAWMGNAGIFYEPPGIYYIVEFDGYYEYSIGDYNPENVRKHYGNISTICDRFDLKWDGYRGGRIYIYGGLPNPKRIVKVRGLDGIICEGIEVDNYNGKIVYATSGTLPSMVSPIKERRKQFAECLSKIPYEKWIEVVKREPEWIHMKPLLEKLGFGKFATTMVVLGLNDFAFKKGFGYSAEKDYWPPLAEILSKAEVPKEPYDLFYILKPFYEEHYIHVPESRETKIQQMDTFLRSDLAKELWNSTPEWVAENLKNIWIRLLNIMNFKWYYKRLSFALKCLGVTLMMVDIYDFEFDDIPIPVDSRVCEFTKNYKLSFIRDIDCQQQSMATNIVLEIICCYDHVLYYLRQKDPRMNMIMLDSLIWQIAKKDCDPRQYFETLECPEVYESLKKFME